MLDTRSISYHGSFVGSCRSQLQLSHWICLLETLEKANGYNDSQSGTTCTNRKDPMKPSTKKSHDFVWDFDRENFDHVEAAALMAVCLDVHQTSPNAMALLVTTVSEVPFVMDTVFIMLISVAILCI